MAIVTFDDLAPEGGKPASPSGMAPDSNNIFSDLTPKKEASSSSFLRRGIGDPLVGLARGTAVGIPETAVGLLDIPTLGHAGKTAEEIGKGLGIGGFQEGREFFDKMLTPETQAAQQKVAEAEGFIDTLSTAVQNPSAIAQVVMESIPSMIAGAGVVGKGAKALGYGIKAIPEALEAAAGGATKIAKGMPVVQQNAIKEIAALQKANLIKGATIGGAGEGLVTAGQNIEQVRQDPLNPSGTLTPEQIALNVAAGAATGVIGVLGGRLAAYLHLADPQTMAAMFANGGIVRNVVEKETWKSFITNGLKTMAREGFLEELPQSMQEQIAQNLSLGKPIDDQVFEQGALGLLAGMAQGGGAHVLSSAMNRMAKDPIISDIETQLAQLGPEVTSVVKSMPAVEAAPVQAAEPVVAPAVAEIPAAPVVIPDPIRAEVAAMNPKDLARTATEDREPIVRQAATEEIQRRAAIPAAEKAAIPVAPVTPVSPAVTTVTPSPAKPDAVQRLLQGKTTEELAKIANENNGEPIGIAASALFEERLKEPVTPTVTPVAEKIDYDAVAAVQGISLENFKKQTDLGQLNTWAKTGVIGAQMELDRRVQEGTIKPDQVTWRAAEAEIPPEKEKSERGPLQVKAKAGRLSLVGTNEEFKQAQQEWKKLVQEGKITEAEFGRRIVNFKVTDTVPKETQNKGIAKILSDLDNTDMQMSDAVSKLKDMDISDQLKVAIADYEKAVKVDKTEYGMRSGLPERAEENLRAAIEKEGLQTSTVKSGPKTPKISEKALVANTNLSIRKEWNALLKSGKVSPEIHAAVNKMLDMAKTADIRIFAVEFEDKEYIAADFKDFQDKDVIDELVNGYGLNRATVEEIAEADRLYRLTTDPAEKERLNETRRIFRQTGKHGVIANAEGQEGAKITLNLGSGEYDVWHEFAHAAELQGRDLSKYGISEEARATNLGKRLARGEDIPEITQPAPQPSKPVKKTKAEQEVIKFSIARDRGARILEDGAKKKFKTIFQIANFLSRRAPINYDTATTAENREVERKLGNFLETSMSKFKQAKGWYRKDFVKAMQILEKLDPSIKKPANNFRMRLAIAISSNGQKSIKTISTAWSAYRNWADNGDFIPTDESKRGTAILNHFNRVNALRSNFKNDLEMEKWLMGIDSLRSIEKTIEVDEDLKLSKGENKDVIVPRASAIFGPKLGAFFNNLSGNFDPVTMDRWFMRTIGRIAGTVIKTADIEKQREAFRNVVTDDVISAVWGNELGIVRASDITEDDLDNLALSIVRGKWKNLSGIHEKARLAGNALGKSLQGELKDSPSSGGEREWIRERVENLRKKYPKFDIADIQAAIWIGEKELYHELGGRKEEADYYSEGAEALRRRVTGEGVVLRRPAGTTGQVRPAVGGVKEQTDLFSIRERTLPPGMARQIYDMAISNPDGFTIDVSTGGKVKKGYAVSPAKETELAFDKLTEKDVYDYIINNGDLFDYDKRAFFGGWLSQDPKSKNFGKFVLDISFVVDNLETAVYLAEHGEQDGIYHIEADNYIPTGEGVTSLKERGVFNEGRRAEHRRIRQEMRSIIEGRRPDQARERYSIRTTSRRTGTGRSQQVRGGTTGTSPEIRVGTGVHYSKEQRTSLDSKFYGTGLADAARLRLPADRKSPLWQRIYFYYDSPEYGVHPEAGVGSYRHDIDLTKYKIYNPYSKTVLVSQVEGENVLNTWEKAILKAGYDGVANPDRGMIVLLGKRKVDVQPAEKYSITARGISTKDLPEDIRADAEATMSDDFRNNLDPGQQVVWVKKNVSVKKMMEMFNDSPDPYLEQEDMGYDIDKLAADAKENGIRTPIIIGPGGVEGKHRILAANLAKMDTIPAYEAKIESRDKKLPQEKYSISTQTNTPGFKKWFGESKVVDENGDPLVVYHGTNKAFNKFKAGKRGGGISFHFNPELADTYATNKDGGMQPQDGGMVYPVYLKAENTWDYENPDHLNIALNALNAAGKPFKVEGVTLSLESGDMDWIKRDLRDGDWAVIESKPVQDAIKAAGFDSYYQNDHPGKAIAVFESTQIKSATGNVGTFDETNADIRYSITAALPDTISSFLGTHLSTFAENPQNLPKAIVTQVADELRTHKDFSKIEYALSVPSRMAQKHPHTWGKLYRIFAVDREENRDEMRQEFQKMAEPFLMYDRQLHDKKVPAKEISASMDRIQRVIIVGDTVATDFTDEQLTEGINDKYGKEVKLSKDEIATYRSVRNTLRHIRTVLVNHLANQSLRGYRRNKWFKVLEAAMKGDSLNVETIQGLLDKKGMKKAALDRVKKLQPNITAVFDRIEAGVAKVPATEISKAGSRYEKIASNLQSELTEVQGYISELTGVTDKAALKDMTREIFSAYMQTRPQMKIIRALRNDIGKLDGYFPRFRETGDKKFRVYEQELDEDGNVMVDENGKEQRKEVYMKMFSNTHQGNDVIRDAMKRLGIKESDLVDGKFPPKYFVEIARQTASPESAYQGVNDINLQRLFDDAMRAAQEKGVHGLETTYKDANGNEIDVFDQLRQAGLQSLTNHLKARGAMQRAIKRSDDLIEGYQETDLQRVLLDYITSMSGLMTKQVAASEAMELLSEIKDPFLFSSMSRYSREMLRNNSLADRVSGYTRAAAFTYFLGGLLKSAVVNLTQNPIVGFAELAKFMREKKLGGAGQSDVTYMKAMKDVLSGNLSEDEKAFIDKMVNRGIASNQFIQSVFDNVMNKGLRKHIAVMNFLAKPFSMSEVFNRKSAAIAMYRTAYSMRLNEAKTKGLTGEAAAAEAERLTFDDARNFVTNVHYAYGKTNRPLPIMTGDAAGAVAASLYTFKGFSHNFLARQAELISQKDFKTLGHTLAYLVLFGGLSTIPFMRDLFDWWEKEYGYNPMNSVRTMLRGIGGDTLEKFGVSGLPSVLGANFSGSLATGLPWPIGAASPEDSIFGVWGGVMTKAKRGAQAFAHGDINRGITELSPEFMRAPRVAIRESEISKQIFGAPGYATNIRGHAILGEDGKPISMSAWEAALKTMGFNPTDYARSKEKTQNVVRQVAWVNDLKQNVAERYRAARLNNDKDAVKDMLANVKKVNDKIRSRNLQRLVSPLKVSNVMKSAQLKRGPKQQREARYKREEL